MLEVIPSLILFFEIDVTQALCSTKAKYKSVFLIFLKCLGYRGNNLHCSGSFPLTAWGEGFNYSSFLTSKQVLLKVIEQGPVG